MRVGLIASTAGHLAVLLWGAIAFPDAKPFEVPPVDTLPVDLVPVSEVTKLRVGEKTAELREVEATKPAEKPAEKPQPVTKAAPEKPAPTPPAPTPPAPREPAPAPKEPASKEPAPAPKEPAPAPKAEPKTEPKPEPPKNPQTPAPQPVSVRPRTKPTPPPPTRTAEKPREFNPNDIAALLNKVEPIGGGSTNQSDTPASLGSRLGESGVTMSQSEIDALKAQIMRCWNPPIGAVGASDLIVTLKIAFTQSGEVNQRPEVLNSSANPSFGIAAESARRAVLRCAPYSMPAAKYDLWREVEITFDPQQLIGG